MMNGLAVEFGAQVRAARKSKNISQDQFALLAGIDRSYMGRIERGEINVTLEKVYQIAKALDCEVEALLPKGNEVILK